MNIDRHKKISQTLLAASKPKLSKEKCAIHERNFSSYQHYEIGIIVSPFVLLNLAFSFAFRSNHVPRCGSDFFFVVPRRVVKISFENSLKRCCRFSSPHDIDSALRMRLEETMKPLANIYQFALHIRPSNTHLASVSPNLSRSLRSHLHSISEREY